MQLSCGSDGAKVGGGHDGGPKPLPSKARGDCGRLWWRHDHEGCGRHNSLAWEGHRRCHDDGDGVKPPLFGDGNRGVGDDDGGVVNPLLSSLPNSPPCMVARVT